MSIDTSQRPLNKGDFVRVVRVPPHIAATTYPFPETQAAFAAAVGRTFRVDNVDWGGWVFFWIDEEHGGIGVQPECVELAEATPIKGSPELP
jgi:hypothetical protein